MDVSAWLAVLGGVTGLAATTTGLVVVAREGTEAWRLRRRVAHDLDMLSKFLIDNDRVLCYEIVQKNLARLYAVEDAPIRVRQYWLVSFGALYLGLTFVYPQAVPLFREELVRYGSLFGLIVCVGVVILGTMRNQRLRESIVQRETDKEKETREQLKAPSAESPIS